MMLPARFKPFVLRIAGVGMSLLILAGVGFAQSILQVYQVGSFNDNFGTSVGNAGDVNADGYDDVLIGARSMAGPAGTFSGRVFVYSGATSGLLYTIDGIAPSEGLGYSLDGAGDVNADGFADLILGAPNAVVGGQSQIGRVVVLSGADGTALYNLDGTNPFFGCCFGRSVSGAGDVNADGFADFVINTPNLVVHEALVYSGADGSILHALAYPHSSGSNHFSFVSGAGDVNADGYDDIILRNPGEYPWGGGQQGSVRVYSGFDGTVLYEFLGTTLNMRLGTSASEAGDVNADGYDDFVYSSFQSFTSVKSGIVFVRSGKDGSLLHRFHGEQSDDRFGASVSGAGDLDNDGYDDIIAGAPGLTHGNPGTGMVRAYSGFDGSILFSHYSEFPEDEIGSAVSGCGDTNGDGHADFLIGSSLFSNYARLVSGKCLGAAQPTNYCTMSPNSVGPGATMGWAGTTSYAQDDLSLTVSGAVPGQAGLFLYGPSQVQVPLMDGFLCVSGAQGPVRIQPPLLVSPTGTATKTLDLTAPPLNQFPYAIQLGSEFNFQFWYRDPGGAGGNGSNLSDGLTVHFCL